MAQDPRYVIAVDGGGTGCRVRLTDARGCVLATSTGGPANAATDFDAARDNILAAIRAAYNAAGLDPQRRGRDVAWLGLAGAGFGDVAARMQAALGFARARVTGDCLTAAQGVLGKSDGAVALMGTGSFFLRRKGGIDRRIGGWGYQLGDEAGGAWLAREMLRRVLHAHDGLCAHSPLSRALLEEHGGDPAALVGFAQAARPGEIARLAPRIAQAAGQGDALAGEVMQAGVAAICRSLDALGVRADGAPLFLLGGLAGVYAPLLPPDFRALLRPPRGTGPDAGPDAAPDASPDWALDGAVDLARRHLLPLVTEACDERA